MSCDYYAGWEGYPDGNYTNPPGSEYGGVPCNPNIGGGGGGGGNPPNWVINQGGATSQSGQYSQTLQAILSGLAIFQHQPYVPTSVQPVQQPQYIPINPQGGYGAGYGGGQNTLGSFQNFIQKNSGAMLLVGAGLVLYMMRPPRRANGLKQRKRR